MKNKKFKKGSFVLVSEYDAFIRNRIGIVVGYTNNKILVYIIDIDFTIEVEDAYLKEI